MKRLAAAFARGKVLATYLCVGDPSLEESIDLALACADAGADVIELGAPFSDPTADGPVIARASQRAIAAGGGLKATLHAARAIRAARADVGLVLFGYYNPIFVRGEEVAARDAAQAGIDALLVVDLPVEEGGALRQAARSRGLGVVPLVAPTSNAARLAATQQVVASGDVPFVYYIAVAGVTGRSDVDAREAGERASAVRAAIGRPVVVGFGIDSRERARAAAARADGAVAGTVLVRAIEEGESAIARRKRVEHIVAELRAGVDEACS